MTATAGLEALTLPQDPASCRANDPASFPAGYPADHSPKTG